MEAQAEGLEGEELEAANKKIESKRQSVETNLTGMRLYRAYENTLIKMEKESTVITE